MHTELAGILSSSNYGKLNIKNNDYPIVNLASLQSWGFNTVCGDNLHSSTVHVNLKIKF